MMYKLVLDTYGNPNGAIKTNEDGSYTWFCFKEEVSDYQAYLTWLDEGNKPEPADEVTE